MTRLIESGQRSSETQQKEIDKLRKINEKYKMNREQYRLLILDITKKVEEKIKALMVENATLRANRR